MNGNKIIIQGYTQAGDDFLAHKLRKVFMLLTTPDEVAEHNDMIRDIQIMVGDIGVEDLRRGMAKTLINGSREFLRDVARHIKNLSLRNIEHGAKN